MRLAKDLAKIPEDEDVRFVDLPEKPSLWESLWGEERDTAVGVPIAARAILRELQPLGRAAFLSGQPALLITEPELSLP